MSPTQVVGALGLPASPPRGAVIDVYNINESILNHLCSIYPAQPHQHQCITNMTTSQGARHAMSCN
jgi:hypothetical protein